MFLSNFLLAVLLYQHTYCLCPKYNDTVNLHFKIKAESFTNKLNSNSNELTYSMSKTVSLSLISNPNKLFKPASKLFKQECSICLAINLKF
jgi:hypothetical protein